MRNATTARLVCDAGAGHPEPIDTAVLSFADRYLRRRLIECSRGMKVLVDLADATVLRQGMRLVLDDGRHVEIIAASEDLAEATGPEIARYAWHVGNRHTPCQVEPNRILIARDHVLEAMLIGLGAGIRHVNEPFSPESGAYGHGAGHDHHGNT